MPLTFVGGEDWERIEVTSPYLAYLIDMKPKFRSPTRCRWQPYPEKFCC
jgi:hypothetical protein